MVDGEAVAGDGRDALAQGADLAVPAWRALARGSSSSRSTLEAVVTGGSADRVRWGDWGEAVLLAFRYSHLRTGADVEIRQAVRVPRDLTFDLTIGARLALICWA